MELYTRWDGPYLLSKISKSGVSGDLTDLKSRKMIGRYAFESLKVFVSQEQFLEATEGWITLAEVLGDFCFLHNLSPKGPDQDH